MKLRLLINFDSERPTERVEVVDLVTNRKFTMDGILVLGGHREQQASQFVSLAGNYNAMANALYLLTRDRGEAICRLVQEINQKLLDKNTVLGCRECDGGDDNGLPN